MIEKKVLKRKIMNKEINRDHRLLKFSHEGIVFATLIVSNPRDLHQDQVVMHTPTHNLFTFNKWDGGYGNFSFHSPSHPNLWLKTDFFSIITWMYRLQKSSICLKPLVAICLHQTNKDDANLSLCVMCSDHNYSHSYLLYGFFSFHFHVCVTYMYKSCTSGQTLMIFSLDVVLREIQTRVCWEVKGLTRGVSTSLDLVEDPGRFKRRLAYDY